MVDSCCPAGSQGIATKEDNLCLSEVEGKATAANTETAAIRNHSIRCSHVSGLCT